MTMAEGARQNWSGLFGPVLLLLVAFLIYGTAYGGFLLASTQVPDEAILQYRYSENQVGALTAWYLRLSNPSAYSLEVEIQRPPVQSLMDFRFKPLSPTAASAEGWFLWKGELTHGKEVEALFVLGDAKPRKLLDMIPALIRASYHDPSGASEDRQAELRESDARPVGRTALWFFWFLLPFLPIVLLGAYIYKKFG
jgi:hypothetical protein